MLWRNRFLFIFSLVFSAPAFAQDVSDAALVNEEYSGKQSAAWEKIQMDLGAVKGKLEAQTSLVMSLIEAKNSLKGEALDKKLEELKIEYQRLQKYTDDYDRMNQEYLTKFPERGTKERRTYRRLKTKSLQVIENEMTIQGRVNKLHTKILSQYPKTKVSAKKTKNTSNPSQDATKVENQKAPEKHDVTEQIKLKK